MAAEELVETKLYIDGNYRPAQSGETYDLFNPARPSELVGRAASAGADDVEQAIEAAHRAFPAWAALDYSERAAILRRIDKVLTQDPDEVAARSRLFTREHGKILKETLLEMSRLGDRFRLAAQFGEKLDKDEELAGPPFDTIIHRQPRGVAALVVPWNWPLSILGAKLPQALVAGNTVVVKPSSNSAMAPVQTLRMIADLLPPGVLNIVTGSAAAIGDAIIGHPLVRTINFTGSIGVGQHVMKVAAENLTPVTLELGGNDAALVLDDAELNAETFQRMYMGTFASTGQICMALKRLYVHESRYDEVVEGLTAACNRAVVGDGLADSVTMGPLNNAGQLGVVRGMMDEARAAGADMHELGQLDDEDLYNGGGYFQRPTLVLDADPQLSVVKEEQFGPILPLLKFSTDEEAIAAANDSRFGLCSSVWTPDPERALRLSKQIEAGYTYINGHGPLAQDSRAPFGGFKQSGIGRNLGFDGVLAFTEQHSISGQPGFLK